MIEQRISAYVDPATSKHHKSVLVNEVLVEIQSGTLKNSQRGFVRFEAALGGWVEVTPRVAREKIGQTFRTAAKHKKRSKSSSSSAHLALETAKQQPVPDVTKISSFSTAPGAPLTKNSQKILLQGDKSMESDALFLNGLPDETSSSTPSRRVSCSSTYLDPAAIEDPSVRILESSHILESFKDPSSSIPQEVSQQQRLSALARLEQGIFPSPFGNQAPMKDIPNPTPEMSLDLLFGPRPNTHLSDEHHLRSSRLKGGEQQILSMMNTRRQERCQDRLAAVTRQGQQQQAYGTEQVQATVKQSEKPTSSTSGDKVMAQSLFSDRSVL